MGSEAEVVPEKKSSLLERVKRWLRPLAVGVAVLGVIIAIGLALLFRMTPEEVAVKWVGDNVDVLGGKVAGVVVDGLGPESPVLEQLGGEWVEDRVREELAWTYSIPLEGPDGYVLIVTGNVNIDISEAPLSGVIEASAPFELLIDGNGVVRDSLLLDGVSVQAEVSGEDVAGGAEEAGQKVAETGGEKVPEKTDGKSPGSPKP